MIGTHWSSLTKFYLTEKLLPSAIINQQAYLLRHTFMHRLRICTRSIEMTYLEYSLLTNPIFLKTHVKRPNQFGHPQMSQFTNPGIHTNSEGLSMILKTQTQVCGRTVYSTAVQEMFVLYLSNHDAPLNKHPIHNDELDQWIYVKSMIMSTVTSTELSLDQDFSFQICENNRQLLISQLRNIKSEGESLIFDIQGNPTLPIKSEELVYIFHCTPTQGRIRTLPEFVHKNYL